MVRTDGPDPSALVPAIRTGLPAVDARIAMYDVATLSDELEEHVTPRRLTTSLLVLFAALASTLAALGIYAVVGYATVQRGRELTIRLALGATRTRNVLLLLRKGLALAASGIVLGLVAASAATRALSSLLFDVTAAGPAAYVVSACAFAGIAVLASLIPASGVRGIDPALALREG